ncbi:MAG: hypothetical protein AB7H93_12815 [Vicinamibacterales bacterium]
MAVVNALVTRLADLVMGPLAALPPVAGVLLAALVTALVILWVVRLTSDQRALAAVKRQIQADLFEMRLFNDDLRGLLRAQWRVLAHNGRYLRLSLVPLVCTAVPLVLAIAQLQAWYGYTGIAPGTAVLVSADLAPGADPGAPALEGEGVATDGRAVYFPSLRQVAWRVVAGQPGTHVLRLRLAGAEVEKRLVAGDAVERRAPLRPGRSFVDQLLEPSEPPLDGPVIAIRVPYPERAIDVLGMSMHWLVLFLIASFAFVLLLRKPLGVVI